MWMKDSYFLSTILFRVAVGFLMLGATVFSGFFWQSYAGSIHQGMSFSQMVVGTSPFLMVIAGCSVLILTICWARYQSK